jgi:UDP-glucose-4-epimerase GalE
MNVLVVGAAGYLGSHCARMLAEAGHTPITFDNLSTGWRDFVKSGPIEEGDTRDPEALARVFRKYSIRTVMHFAAFSLVGESTKKPLEYWDNNVTGGLRLLEASRDFGVESVVLSSTAAVYGEPDRVPIRLDSRVQPINPYGATKAALERAIADLARTSTTFGATCFRYFNPAGAHPGGGIGERHEPETHLIPNALSATWNGRPVSLFGDDYETFDGTCVRNYVLVLDVVSAHVAGDIDVAERELPWTPRHRDAEPIVLDAWGGPRAREATVKLGLGLAALGRPGCINIGHASDFEDRSVEVMRDRASAVLDAAFARGVRYFDAARSYGRAEEFLAEWIRSRRIEEHTLDHFEHQLAETRALLGAHLSLCLIHSATLESRVLEDASLLWALSRLEESGIAQATYNVLERSAEPALIAAHASGRRVIVKEANGRLTSRGDRLQRESKRAGVSADALAIAFVLQRSLASVVLSGAVAVAQLDSSSSALDLEEVGSMDDLRESSADYWQKRGTLPWN